MVKYLSEEWRAEVEKRLREQLTPEKMALLRNRSPE